AINTADEAQRKELAHWLSLTENSIDEATRKDKVAAVTRLYNEMAIDKMAENKINQYFDECRKVLDQLDVDPQRKAELIAYTNQMMKRNR
ncbi:MAG: polyprenyl synthetase family protein, partial [Prevotella sp.]|nr:polyprenyl synthetase family protein [Prevotella sp.]